MANFSVIIKDDQGREHYFRINNIFTIRGEGEKVEIHCFGGPDAQRRYDNFIETYTSPKKEQDDGKKDSDAQKERPGAKP